MRLRTILALGLAFLTPGIAQATNASDSGEARFRALHKEVVETNTTLSEGSCTIAAEKMRQRLLAAGYPESDTRIIVAPGFPRQGNLVAQLRGSDPKAPAILLLAHIDVVEAKRADWQRDPFTLVEDDGYVYGRGVVDDKAMAAAFVDAFVRFREEKFRPRHTLKLALTCGEETYEVFNGVQYLLEHDPETLSAGFALNEGGNGELDADGKPLLFGVQAGEKVYQDIRLVATSPGGHSARPGKDNAITRLAAALVRIGAYDFPVAISDVTRNYFARSARLYQGQMRVDMAAIGAGTADAPAVARIADALPAWNAALRTTCVATLVKAGHAANALAQHAEANVNCRILPGQRISDIRADLVRIVADPTIDMVLASEPGPLSAPPALDPRVMRQVEAVAARMWPGVPVVPGISAGGTDGRFLVASGIPTYGISAVFRDPDGNGVHGLNERVRVKSLIDSRNFLYRLIKALSEAPARRR